MQNVIRHAEGFGESGFLIRQPEQVLVRNNDQRIDHLLKRINAVLGLLHTFGAFELERLGDHPNGQNAKFPRSLSDNRCCPCPGAAAHTGCDETHVCASQMIDDLFDRLLGRRSANGRPCACAEALGDLHAHLDFRRCIRLLQSLRVRIRNNEFDAFQLLFNHVVDGITASAPNPENRNPWLQLVMGGYHQIQRHWFVRLYFFCLARHRAEAPPLTGP